MAEARAKGRVVTLQGAWLSVAEVQRVAGEIETTRAAQTAIDCSSLRGVTADGLAALYELGRQSGGSLALTNLSRELTRVAVEARLARCFAIHATLEGFQRALLPRSADPAGETALAAQRELDDVRASTAPAQAGERGA